MENHSAPLDAAFHALSDATRRGVVRRLTSGPATVMELAEPYGMGLPAFLKHLRVLEESGLIETAKAGRVRTCRVRAARLAEVEDWLAAQRAECEASADRLARFVETRMAGEGDG